VRTALEGYYNGDPCRAVRAAKRLLLAAAAWQYKFVHVPAGCWLERLTSNYTTASGGTLLILGFVQVKLIN
jgi:hypothetical protein